MAIVTELYPNIYDSHDGAVMQRSTRQQVYNNDARDLK